MAGLTIFSVLSIFGLLYFGNGILAKQSAKLTENKANNQVLEKQELALIKAKHDIEKYKNLEEVTQKIVPSDKDQARATREIVALAQDSGFKIKTITFPASNLGTKVAPTKNQDSAQSTPQEPAPNPISQAKPVKDIKGVYSLEANVIPEGSVNYYQFINFLSKLEKNRRTAQVTSIKIDPKASSKDNPLLTFTLTLNIFLKP